MFRVMDSALRRVMTLVGDVMFEICLDLYSRALTGMKPDGDVC